MPAITEEQIERVRALVGTIPVGFVATYGDIADAAELSSPRTVGAIMRMDSADLPWHRVLSASGRPAPTLREVSSNGFAARELPSAAAASTCEWLGFGFRDGDVLTGESFLRTH